MLQNRSLLPEVEVLSHKGDKTSICCVKLLQSVWNFYPCSNDENAPPPHNGPKSLILAPQDIPDNSGYLLEFECQCVKVYNNENAVTNQKIL